ncbi:hypothetical protein D3C72_2369350 [compost metagenome]
MLLISTSFFTAFRGVTRPSEWILRIGSGMERYRLVLVFSGSNRMEAALSSLPRKP